MKKNILFFALILFIANAECQNAFISLDTNQILIGDQVKMNITLQNPPDVPILFPLICDTCIPHLEIVSRGNTDTLLENGQITLRQQYTITGFDSGSFDIPSFVFYTADSETVAQTPAGILHINTIQVDTNQAIKDIKPPLKAPLTFKEIFPYLTGIIVLALIVSGIIWLIRRYSPKRKKASATPAKPLEPAEVIALRDLESLWQKKLCEKGHYKEFYSKLSLITRTYIFHRWDIPSLEMVTTEVCQALHSTPASDNDIHNVQHALEVADLVKFAKVQPLDNENKANYDYIVTFVKNTTPVSTPKDEK
ncbi:MAG: OadG family protein [Bacteroidales bacterium]|nr:OadG family protein [Bacteroidales bacterium]